MAKRKKHSTKRANREERIQKRKQAIVTYFIVILMIASVAGFALSGNQAKNADTLKYNGFTFDPTIAPHPLVSGYSINSFVESGSEVLFYTSPYEAEQIPIKGNLTQMLAKKPYFVYLFEPGTDFDSLHDWMRFELSSKTSKMILPALTKPSEVYSNLSVLSCANATVDMPILFVMQSNKTAINITKTGCVQIQTRPQDLIIIRDRIFYSLFGIMNK